MDLKEKQLLLADLCARLPYGVICKSKCIEYDDIDGDDIEWDVEGKLEVISDYYAIIKSCQCELEYTKPYLRHLSSMTKDEKFEYDELSYFQSSNLGFNIKSVDWLNAHHFDYRGLLERGLALEAPTGMYV